MPTPVRETLLAAAFAKLSAISSVAGLTAARIERNRRDEIAAFPFLVMRDAGERVTDRLVGMDRVAIALDVECYVRSSSSSGAAAGLALTELYGAAHAALLADHTLGAGAFDVRLVDVGDPLFDVTDGADTVASLVARFEIEAWLRPDDPFNLAP